MLGYNSINGQFNPGPLIGITKRAMADQDNIYFVCLDEKNLARVEYYFSDLLSVMKTKAKMNGKINRLEMQ
ncbi:hypothetical protein [Halanaerobaculum tunisiense]